MQFAGYQQDPYGAGLPVGGAAPYGATHMSWKPKAQRRRMNVLAIALNLFVPWIIFCSVLALLSFEMHYKKPATCQSVVVVITVVIILGGVLDVAYMIWKRRRGEGGFSNASWVLVLSMCSLVALGIAVYLGGENYWVNSSRYYDVMAMNNYNDVDPSRMRGQEIMDAGRVLFVNGTHLDLSKSMGFKNSHTYCVAPIAGGNVVGNPPLSHYDFWAVGKECCSGQAGGGDFKCGDYDNPKARGGVRLVSYEDRDFYRLAVQQAQSTFNIRATHPLFFHWTARPDDATNDYMKASFKTYLVGMFSYFGFQLLLVYIGAVIFNKFHAS